MTRIAIPWSDDCFHCLCNLPHTMHAHMQAVERALAELREEQLLLRHETRILWDEESADEDAFDDDL